MEAVPGSNDYHATPAHHRHPNGHQFGDLAQYFHAGACRGAPDHRVSTLHPVLLLQATYALLVRCGLVHEGQVGQDLARASQLL